MPPAPAVHFGFRATTATDVRSLRDRLGRAGADVIETCDEDGYVGVKCRDPDGYVVEVYWEGD